MALYYVDNDGTATGDTGRFTTKQTGSFTALGTANAYLTIDAALAAPTPPASGDFIVCSEFYHLNKGSSIISRSWPTTGPGVTCISVNDTSIDSYKKGAKEETNSTFRTNGKVAYIGFILDTSVTIQTEGNTSATYKDCNLVLSSSSDWIGGTVDGGFTLLLDCEIDCAFNSNRFRLQGGCRLDMIGGGFTATTNVSNLLNESASSGGCTLNVTGADLSVIDGILINSGDNPSIDDIIEVEIEGCTLNASVVESAGFANYGQTLKITRSSSSSANAEYQYYNEKYPAIVTSDDSIFRNEDEPFTESNQKISYKIETNANCSAAIPLILDFPILRYSKLSDTAEDTLRFYLTSNSSLTNNDIYIEVIYPDGANKQSFNMSSSQDPDFFAVGTALDNDGASSWTGALSNLYQIDLDASGGADCQPIVKVYVTIPNTIIQIASEFGLS